MKELVKDERTHKIAGTVLLLICVFLFTCFSSYLFTWSEDQSVVESSSIFFPDPDVKVANVLGTLGAWVSHQFFFNGFGLASFLFCILFFVLGINALTGRKQYSFYRHLRYVLAGILYFSVLLAFITEGSAFPWGGEAGNMAAGWLKSVLGWWGAAGVLFVAGLAYIIWRFNPVFAMPARKAVPAAAADITEGGEAGMLDQPLLGKTKKGRTKARELLETEPDEAEKGSFVWVQDENGKPVRLPGPGRSDRPHPQQDVPVNYPDEGEENGLEGIMVEKDTIISAGGESDSNPMDLELVINEVDAEPAEEPAEQPAAGKMVELTPYEPTLDLPGYEKPSIDLLENYGSEKIVHDPGELEANKEQIISTLRNYDIQIRKISATVGPTVTLYEIVPVAGVRISRIRNLEDDIALSLAALGIRIIAPIPGKGTIGIEVPNVKKTVVGIRSLLNSEKFRHNNYNLPIAIGKRIDNENFIVDLTTMPHLLMAGATGQGKSVGLNAILVSLLYKKHPSQLKLVLVDPKKVELSLYRCIEKHFLAKLPNEEEAIITDTRKVIHTLNALCIEMDNRYDLLKEAGARNIREYNEKFVKRRLNPQKGHQFLPFIVLVIDEFADLIMTAGKEVEMPIARLAQLARAVGIHLIIATQRPSVNIITGTIKANFPARIAFKVSSKIDSRTILDIGGAEQLIGKGDMLVSYNGELTRLQCAFVDTPEVDKICEFIGQQRGYPDAFLLPEYIDEKEMEGKDISLLDRDPLFEEAARLIVQHQSGSTSLIQRRMKLGYNRAGRLMDQLEAAGVVGQTQGSKPRDVLIKTEAELEQHLVMLG